jgi:hypothetical protein
MTAVVLPTFLSDATCKMVPMDKGIFA